MNLKLCFRVDSSLKMGIGHVMRCLTLADSLKSTGSESQFICREHEGNLIEVIRSRGYIVHNLPLSDHFGPTTSLARLRELTHAEWLGATQMQDVAGCVPILDDLQPDWLILDHYALDAQWEQALKPRYGKLMVIDDLADRPHICDLLLDQTFGRDPEDYRLLVPDRCRLLCGSQYALLRPEFAALRSYSLQRREQPKLRHLLISMGGVDKDNVTLQVLEALQAGSLPEQLRITAVMGPTAPWLAEVMRKAKSMHWSTTVQVAVDDMATLMANSDLAIGAAGATSWERCCLGVPSLMAVVAENQQAIAGGLDRQGAAISIGNPLAPDFFSRLQEGIRRFREDPEALKRMAQCAASLVDGEGVVKTVNHLIRKIN